MYFMGAKDPPYWLISLNGELMPKCLSCLVNAHGITLSKDREDLNFVLL